ncbi:MAG TPA: hypothetical protein VFY11_03890 [Nocardioidaceae bacterium]|nr:hypothetical protein [Nocardioidaceae bacterium]
MSTPSTPGGTGTQTWPTTPTGSEAQPTGSTEDKKEQAKQVAGTAADEAKQTAGTARDEAKNVAGTAKDEARNVMAEGRQQAAGLLDEARTQVDDQARTQRDRLVSTLRSFGDDLEKMANGEQTGGGMAQDLARQAADRAREISSRVDGREPAELLDEVRSFARRRPGTFLLGAVAAGVIAGRLTRGAKDAQRSEATTGSRTPLYDDVRATMPPSGGTATGAPTAGTGYPDTPPAYPTGSGVGEPGTTMEQPGVSGAAGTPPTPDNPWAGDANRGGAL